VLPPDGPWQPARTARFLEFQDSVRERSGYRWIEETWRRKRYTVGAGVAAGSV